MYALEMWNHIEVYMPVKGVEFLIKCILRIHVTFLMKENEYLTLHTCTAVWIDLKMVVTKSVKRGHNTFLAECIKLL